MNEAPLFHLRHVRKQYGNTLALDIDDLNIRSGEALCLLGPTGAGKSTLLRLLAAVENPTTGEILFRGEPLARQRSITLVFQRPLLLRGTVRANVEYGLRLRGSSDSMTAVNAIIERLGLSKLAEQPARTLSGGQAQLVALARALVLEPEVLLLDEPTSDLDPARVALVEAVIRDVANRKGTSVILATHNLFQSRRIADRVGLLLDGRLIEAAPAERFFAAPSDPRTRDFVDGKMIY